MNLTYLRLAFVAVCPVIASALLYILDKRTKFGSIDNRKKQILYGIIFGVLAVIGTEFGVPIEGAVINVRDAAPLCAGLLFGSLAGIISGIIGGTERWFAVLWGAGEHTRLACTMATVVAGLLGAALRKWMFDNKKPLWYYGFAIGVVVEVIYMLMIFFTNVSDVYTAFVFVKRCSLLTVLANAVSVTLAVLVVSFLGKGHRHRDKEYKKLSQTFSRWLMLVILAALCCTSVITFILQTSFSSRNSDALLTLNIEDVKADIEDASDENLLRLTRNVAADINNAGVVNNKLLHEICNKDGNDFSEINYVDKKGIIIYSTNTAFIGFDMYSGKQSRAFTVLLDGVSEFVQGYQSITHDSYVKMKYAGVSLDNGDFVQVGYNAERFRSDIDTLVVGATRNRHVGKSGYILIASDDCIIVSDPNNSSEGQTLEKTGIIINRDSISENVRFECMVYGMACYCMYAVTEGYCIIAVQPVEEVLFSRDLSVYLMAFMEILIFATLFILIYFLIKMLVVENIHRINGALGEITGGNLNVAVDVRTNEEFASLSDDINTTVFTLKGYIAEAAARIDKELEIAKVIQLSSLPCTFPPYPDRTDFDVFASMNAAKEVGGDFYDLYLLDENRLAFLVADVSGKGITAAMFMMKAKTLLKDYAEKEDNVADILTKANEALCEGNDAEMFVTCWMGILNFAEHTVSFANAGHNPPLVRHKNGNFEFYKSRPGFVLGGMEGSKYCQGEFPFNPGDEIYLYTDGVTEATNINNELFGDSRLYNVLNTMADVSAEKICRAVKENVDSFVGEAPQFDDMTMLHLHLLQKNIITLMPCKEKIPEACAFVEKNLEHTEVPVKIITKMNVAVDEIFSNIASYSGASEVKIECCAANGKVLLTFIDNGKPYDPLAKPDPDITKSAEEREIGGLGIYMVKKTMDKVEYQYRCEQNILTLTKFFP